VKPRIFTSAKESPTVSREVMRRGEEFLAEARSDQKIRALEAKYLVQSSDGQSYYLVDLNGTGRCDCADFFFSSEHQPGYQCKHIRLAMEFRDSAEQGKLAVTR
jgi:predicted nucleic acid-binding Zn finger protein